MAHIRWSQTGKRVFLGMALLVFTSTLASAQTPWTGSAGDNNFTTGGNWSSGAPNSTTPAYFQGVMGATITVTSDQAKQLFIKSGSNVTLNLTSANTLELNGDPSNPYGAAARVYENSTLTLTGSGTVQADLGSFSVGRTDDDGVTPTNGTLNIMNSVQINLDRPNYTNMFVGIGNDVAGSTGTVNQSGTSKVTLGSNMIVGDTGGTGNYTLSGNAVLTTGTVAPANLSGSTFIYIGLNEDGNSPTANAATSGTLTLNNSSEFDFSSGYVKLGDNLDNGTSWAAGKGKIVQNDSSTVKVTSTNGGAFSIGNAQGGTGEYDLNGGLLYVNQPGASQGFLVGAQTGANGLLKQTGGTLNALTNIIVGFQGTGAYTITGGFATFGGGLSLGALGTANLNGGTVQAGGAGGISGSGALNLGGGTLQVVSSDLTTTVSTALATSTLSTIDTNGFNAAFSGGVSGSGALKKIGSGALTLASASSYSGATTVTGGKLVAANTSGSATGSSAVDVQSGAAAGGGNGADTSGSFATPGTGSHIPSRQTYAASTVGIIGGSLTIENGAHLAPGDSVGTLTTAHLTLQTGSILDYEFNATANDFMAVTASGGLTLGGGAFNLYQENTTTAFDAPGLYDLIGYTGSFTGSLSSLSVANPQSGFSYTFVNDTTDGVVQLQVTPTPEPTSWFAFLLGASGLLTLGRWRRVRREI